MGTKRFFPCGAAPASRCFYNEERESSLLSYSQTFYVFASQKIAEGVFIWEKPPALWGCRRSGSLEKRRFCSMEKSSTRRLVILAMMVAANIVLSRFLSISLWNLKIGFAFVPVVIAAILYGPVAGGLVGAVGDYIGATLFPIGQYFPGFTATAFLVGAAYGFFLHKKQDTVRIFSAVLLTECIGSLLLNTLWISLLFGAPFAALLPPRIVQCIVMGTVEVLVIRAAAGYLPVLRPAK